MLDLDHGAARPVDWLLGACMCVRRSAVQEVGPLDEGYFLYVEDIDWARRMHAGGWEVYYVPAAQFLHHHLAVSDKRLFSRRTLIHTLSMWRYARKYLLPPLPGLRIKGYEDAAWRGALSAQATGGDGS
jgi:GT2 family glycosyltransferase